VAYSKYAAADDIDGLMWAAHHALEELIETTPTTLPGVVALLRATIRITRCGGPFDVRDAAEKLPSILADVISEHI
jgi:hypothetical protein